MSDSTIQIAPDSTGKLIDVATLLNGASQTVNRQVIAVGDPANIGSVQAVKAGATPATAADPAAVVVIRPDGGGSVGKDFSANPQAWPVIGANFAAGSALFPSWSLIATVPSSTVRAKITVDNMSNGPILCLRDDGTAGTGAEPVNATAFIVNAKASAGPEGGHYESATFRGRLQVFAADPTQFVAVSTD